MSTILRLIFVLTIGFLAAESVANPIPGQLARVVSGNRTLTTLGGPKAADVFVVAADDIAGMNAAQSEPHKPTKAR